MQDEHQCTLLRLMCGLAPSAAKRQSVRRRRAGCACSCDEVPPPASQRTFISSYRQIRPTQRRDRDGGRTRCVRGAAHPDVNTSAPQRLFPSMATLTAGCVLYFAVRKGGLALLVLPPSRISVRSFQECRGLCKPVARKGPPHIRRGIHGGLASAVTASQDSRGLEACI